MSGTYHAIIILPGTTGTSLVSEQKNETSNTPLWQHWAIREAIVPESAKRVAAELEASLYAGRPGGFSDGTGYSSLINAIVTGANKTHPSTPYKAVYSDWPTNQPPVPAQSKQSWLSSPLTGNAVIGWGYDWRQDNLITAKMLQNFLYNLVTYNNVGKITLIAHSMGGIVSRTYLESVGTSDTNILGMIDQLITLGTPHLGAPLALAPISNTLHVNVNGKGNANFFIHEWNKFVAALDQVAVDNIVAMVHQFVNSTSGISTYQLLPPDLTNSPTPTVAAYAAFIRNAANTASYPVYPQGNLPQPLQDLLADAGLNGPDLSGASALFGKLNYTANPNPGIAYRCIYGVVSSANPSATESMTTTTTGFIYNPPSPTARASLATVDTDGGGDTVVPTVSAMFAGNPTVSAYEVPGADHLSMASNRGILVQVLTLLGFPIPGLL